MNLLRIAVLSNVQRPVSRKSLLIYFAAVAFLFPFQTFGQSRRSPGVRSVRLVEREEGKNAVYQVILDRRFKIYELDTLAQEVRRSAPKVQTISILCFLRGMKPDKEAWATCRFNPSLDAFEIRINETAVMTNPPDPDLQTEPQG